MTENPPEKPSASRPSFIVLDGQKTSIEEARFSIALQTEAWDANKKAWVYGPGHLEARYSLSIRVTEESGEDGAPAPEAQVIPVFRAARGRHLLPRDLDGLTVEDEGDWEAWFGNDAPPLENNRLVFGRWSAEQRLGISWSATYSDRRGTKDFLFEGEATFDGISVRVKREADADEFMTQVFGQDCLGRLRKETGSWVEHGEQMPPDRRRWLPIRYLPMDR